MRRSLRGRKRLWVSFGEPMVVGILRCGSPWSRALSQHYHWVRLHACNPHKVHLFHNQMLKVNKMVRKAFKYSENFPKIFPKNFCLEFYPSMTSLRGEFLMMLFFRFTFTYISGAGMIVRFRFTAAMSCGQIHWVRNSWSKQINGYTCQTEFVATIMQCLAFELRSSWVSRTKRGPFG